MAKAVRKPKSQSLISRQLWLLIAICFLLSGFGMWWVSQQPTYLEIRAAENRL